MKHGVTQLLPDAELLRAYENNNSGSVQSITAALQAPEVARVDVPSHLARSWVVTLNPLSSAQAVGLIPNAPGDLGWLPQDISTAYAIIEWAAGRQGGMSFVAVDWNLGQTFSLYASRIVVRGVITSFATELPGTALTQMSAFIVPGSTPNRAVRTVSYGTIIAATQVELPVPAFARQWTVSLDQTISGLAGLRLRGRFSAGGVQVSEMSGGLSDRASNTLSIGVPLAMGNNFMAITNGNAFNVDAVRLRYELAL